MFLCLQHAEHLDAVRRHVRSKITQQNHKGQRDPEISRSPQSLMTNNGTGPDVPQCQGRTKGESVRMFRLLISSKIHNCCGNQVGMYVI